MSKLNNNDFYYTLGKRDAYAEILALEKDKVKLPDIAKLYKEMSGEEHFSHKWHTN